MAFLILGISIYIWIAVISFIFLLILAIFGDFGLDIGGDVDADLDYGQFSGPGISPLSPTMIAVFGCTFGSVGALLETAGLGTVAVAALAVVVGVVIAGGLFVFVERFLIRSQTSSDVRREDLIGASAQVTVPIAPGANGQILVITEERGRSLFSACAQSEIPRDAIVEIVGFTGGVANVRKKGS